MYKCNVCKHIFDEPLTVGAEDSETLVCPKNGCHQDNFDIIIDAHHPHEIGMEVDTSEDTLLNHAEGISMTDATQNAIDDFKVMVHSQNEMNAHRYRVVISHFIYADNDAQAQEIASEHVKMNNSEYANNYTLEALDRVDIGTKDHIKII